MSSVWKPDENDGRGHHYYKSPFLTCQACNSITFTEIGDIDSYRSVSVGNDVSTYYCEDDLYYLKRNNNCFEVCFECSRSNHFQIGSKDLTYTLASNSDELTRKKKKFHQSIIVIQKSMRKYQKRLLSKAITRTQVIQHAIKNICASVIQSLFRVIICSKRASVERALLKIKLSFISFLHSNRLQLHIYIAATHSLVFLSFGYSMQSQC